MGMRLGHIRLGVFVLGLACFLSFSFAFAAQILFPSLPLNCLLLLNWSQLSPKWPSLFRFSNLSFSLLFYSFTNSLRPSLRFPPKFQSVRFPPPLFLGICLISQSISVRIFCFEESFTNSDDHATIATLNFTIDRLNSASPGTFLLEHRHKSLRISRENSWDLMSKSVLYLPLSFWDILGFVPFFGFSPPFRPLRLDFNC